LDPGSEIWGDPEKTYFRITDPGVKKAPDRSATLPFSSVAVFWDPGWGKNQYPGSVINIPDPQH